MAIGTNFLFLMSIKVHRLWYFFFQYFFIIVKKHVMKSAVTADFKRHTERQKILIHHNFRIHRLINISHSPVGIFALAASTFFSRTNFPTSQQLQKFLFFPFHPTISWCCRKNLDLAFWYVLMCTFLLLVAFSNFHWLSGSCTYFMLLNVCVYVFRRARTSVVEVLSHQISLSIFHFHSFPFNLCNFLLFFLFLDIPTEKNKDFCVSSGVLQVFIIILTDLYHSSPFSNHFHKYIMTWFIEADVDWLMTSFILLLFVFQGP